MMNLGVKALLSWVNSIKLSDSELRIGDLQDGAILVKLISVLKKKHNPSLSNSSEDWVDFVAEFLE
ncbi:hypothetical protein CHARACLAT_020330, partial [Characodon lateralis]|nr:hypothetical protein [Characodon lateralis]